MSNSPDRVVGGAAAAVRGAVRFLRLVRVRLLLRRRVQLGANIAIGRNATLLPPDLLRIGSNVRIGRDFHVETNLEIGDDVLISSRVAVVGNDHSFDGAEVSVYSGARLPTTTTRIEGDTLIGFGAVIVGGVTIGRGCIVGAGAVVTRDLPANAVCVGVPARPVRGRVR